MKIGTRSETVRSFIIKSVCKHPTDIAKHAAEHFGCTRQAIHKHLQRLKSEGLILTMGDHKTKVYSLAPLVEWSQEYSVSPKLEEGEVWRNDVKPQIGVVAKNVEDIWAFGFTEMLNNAIEHSGATRVVVFVTKTAASTQIILYDNGVGIFKKIQRALELTDERHAVLELAKGKFTTDPLNHTGQGIFFSSRMFDTFAIQSGEVHFSHQVKGNDDWIGHAAVGVASTFVFMELSNHTARTSKKIIDAFTDGDDYGFTKTLVPVRLAQLGNESLVSRSQAKRLLNRIDRFKVVVFDFEGLESIGQSFADEVFRVFALRNPQIELTAVNAGRDIKNMISRARS